MASAAAFSSRFCMWKFNTIPAKTPSRPRTAAGARFAAGVVLYDGETVVAFADDLFAVPIYALWSLAAAPGSANGGSTRGEAVEPDGAARFSAARSSGLGAGVAFSPGRAAAKHLAPRSGA